MKRKRISDVLNNLDEDMIAQAALDKPVRHPSWVKWTAMAACFCLLITAVLWWAGLGNPVAPTVDDPTGNHIWTYQGKQADTATFVKLSNANLQTQLNITSAVGQNHPVEEDACVVLFGQFCSAIFDFDYRNHFRLFPQLLVDAKFTAVLSEKGISFEQALTNIEQTAEKVAGYREVSFSYTVDHYDAYFPESEGYAALFDGYESCFEEAGVEISAITEVRIYYFKDVFYTIGGEYMQEVTTIWDRGLSFSFYQYDGKWNVWPNTIDDDISIDLAQSEEGKGYLKQLQITGTVQAVEGDYFSLGGTERYFAPEEVRMLQPGQQVHLTYYSGLGIRLECYPDGKVIELVPVISVEIVPQ